MPNVGATREGNVVDVALFPLTTRRRTGALSIHVMLRLELGSGAFGWGELSDLDCYRATLPDLDTMANECRRLLVGFDVGNVNSLHRRLSATLLDFRYGARTYPPFSLDSQLAAALEMACLDAAGRGRGVSVSELLGGVVRTTIPTAYPLFAVEGADGVADGLLQTAAAVDRGVDTFRIYVGTDLAASTEFVVECARHLAGRGVIKGLDFGGRFPWKVVLRFLRGLEGVDIPLVESASWHEDVDGLAQLRRSLDADVCEHVSSVAQLRRLTDAGAIDVANVSIQSGGVLVARRLLELADAAGLTSLIGTTQELSLGTAAGAHLAATTLAELGHPADIVGPQLYLDDPVVAPVRYVGSELVVPTGPGLGVDVDEAALGRLAGWPATTDDYAHGEHYVAR